MVQFPVDTVQRTSLVAQGQRFLCGKQIEEEKTEWKPVKEERKKKKDESWKNLDKKSQGEIKKGRQTVRKEVNWTKIIKMKDPKSYNTRGTKDEDTNEEITKWQTEKKESGTV